MLNAEQIQDILVMSILETRINHNLNVLKESGNIVNYKVEAEYTNNIIDAYVQLPKPVEYINVTFVI